MTRRLIVDPDGWPCSFGECRPGLFVFEDDLFLKSEYGGEAYCDSGEMFWGGTSDKSSRDALMVQPAVCFWGASVI